MCDVIYECPHYYLVVLFNHCRIRPALFEELTNSLEMTVSTFQKRNNFSPKFTFEFIQSAKTLAPTFLLNFESVDRLKSQIVNQGNRAVYDPRISEHVDGRQKAVHQAFNCLIGFL